MYCRILEIWEPEQADGTVLTDRLEDGTSVPRIGVSVKWSLQRKPWVTVAHDHVALAGGIPGFALWLGLRAKALDRTHDRERLPQVLVDAIGKTLDAAGLVEQLAPRLDVRAEVARQRARDHSHPHIHSHGGD